MDLAGGLVLAEALERGLADEVVGGPSGEIDLSDKLGFDPYGSAFCLGWRMVEGGCGSTQFFNLVAEETVSFLSEAGARTASVDEFLRCIARCGRGVFVVPEQQSADAVDAVRRQSETADNE